MGLNKIQLKARTFELIEPLRKAAALDDFIIRSTILKLRNIEDADFEFISRLLIKEADEKNHKVASGFLYIAENLAPEAFVGLVMNELNSNRVADEKKIFLINILSGFGIHFEPESIGAFLSNPDEAISCETTKFLENAKADPEAQIDFLDFYFSSSDEDKKELLNSVTSDFEGDRLSNILSSLVLSVDDTDTVMYCLDIMEKTKSPLLVKPLRYLSCSKNKPVAKRAAKTLRKMYMQGAVDDEKIREFYKKLLEDFDAPHVLFSLPDGNSNFSVVISRKTKEGAWFVAFIAVNIELGPFSCFGFSSISKFDYASVIKRFFNTCVPIEIPPPDAKKILDTLVLKRISLNKIIPYEYFCWERLTDDIEIVDDSLEDILKKGLQRVNTENAANKIASGSSFVENWFFRNSKNNPAFSSMIEKVDSLNSDNIGEIENFVFEYSKNEDIKNILKKRILYLAFGLKHKGLLDFANIYYSLLYDESELEILTSCVLKRSIYEYALNARLPKVKDGNLFKKMQETETKDVGFLIDYIENNWVED